MLPTREATAVLAAGPDSYTLCSERQWWDGRDGRKRIPTSPCDFNNAVFLLTALKIKLLQEQRAPNSACFLTHLVFMPPLLRWETARIFSTPRSPLSTYRSLQKERYV